MKKHFVKIKVLQNGYPTLDLTWPTTKKKSFSLSSKPGQILCLPFYFPQGIEVPFLELDRTGVHFCPPRNWRGYLTSEGRAITEPRGEYRLTLNDYANFQTHDLRIMLRIVGPPPPKKRSSPIYKGSFFKLEKEEWRGLGSAVFGVLFVYLVLLVGLLSLQADRPSRFEELSHDYTLPFIHPSNLIHSPEALHDLLDRKDYVSSVVNYYRNTSRMFMGWPLLTPNYVFPVTAGTFSGLYEDQATRVAELATEQEAVERIIQDGVILTLPTVYGESFRQRLYRLLYRIEGLNHSLGFSLDLRRRLIQEFRNDPEYDWSAYLSTELGPEELLASQGNEQLAQIKIFKQETNEEMMYSKALRLARRAQVMQMRIARSAIQKPMLIQADSREIAVPAGVPYISFLRAERVQAEEKRFLELQSLSGDWRYQDREEEPIIGSLAASAVESLVKKHRFQLNLCYERALRRRPKLRGTMHWTWLIDTLGRGYKLQLLESGLQDQQMALCIRRQLASWAFPKPQRGSVQISYVFDFQPHHDG